MADSTPQERNFREETEMNRMNREPLTTIEREVESWSGVTTGDTGRGGLQFNYGRVELGHLHGSSFADLPFPK